MRRLLPVASALAFAFCAYAIQSVQLPGRALACSCMPQQPLADVGPDTALVVATVGQTLGFGFDAGTVVEIERTFAGDVPAQILVQGIGEQGAACQLSARAGDRWILDLYRSPEGRYGVSLCGINAPLGSPAGEALLAEAVQVFGEGQTPAPPEEAPAAPVDLAPWLGGLGWAAALVLVSVAVFGLIAFAASRRRSP